MDITEVFSANLRRVMQEKRYRAVDIVNGMGVSKQIVSSWVNGYRVPRMRMLDDLCTFLDVRRSDLLEEHTVSSAQFSNATGYVKLYDGIPAGAPAFLDEQVIDHIPTLLPHPENYAAIKVHGDSMVGAGIVDGCTVMIKKQDCADDGQIVACRVNNEEVTLKRFRQQGETVLLMPENASYSPLIVPVSDFENGSAQILGVLVQIIIDVR